MSACHNAGHAQKVGTDQELRKHRSPSQNKDLQMDCCRQIGSSNVTKLCLLQALQIEISRLIRFDNSFLH